ncbi:hypothetical protein EVAR_9233_1 [Eumeta japonica]|uniref:Uncharacterized protein n=1 Tax=Eumeta variegata TaxID=151549 RepID=A0A4C2AHB0_EUMVA|nr:hypothetical protein EVAR_9233_1 [Eumeta japonica]
MRTPKASHQTQPSRRRYGRGYVRAKEVYERAAADAQTTELETVLHRPGQGAYGMVSTGSSGTGRNREDVLLINDSGQTCSPNESAVLLANTFFLMTVYRMVRTTRN